MRHPWQIWLTFAGCVAVVAGAVGWLNWKALELDRAEAVARSLVQHEENVRLALWRMDSSLAPLLMQESARPTSGYSAFTASAPASGKQPKKVQASRIPSPLLIAPVPKVRLHFQIDPEGHFSSPQIPAPADRRLAVAAGASVEEIDRAQQRLLEVQAFCEQDVLLASVPASPPAGPPVEIVLDNNAMNPQWQQQPQMQIANGNTRVLPYEQGTPQQAVQPKIEQLRQQQEVRNFSEYQARSQAINRGYNGNAFNNTVSLLQPGEMEAADAHAGVLTPVWLGHDLVLARRVALHGQEYLQGCWLDWPTIKRDLLDGSQDLLYGADLQPILDPAEPEHSRRLAALPVKLVDAPLAEPVPELLSPIRLSLLVTWASLFVVVLAVAALLQGVIALSERRAAFVSAVTHELRTPLTTFRMYSEMLAEGMVPNETDRRHYLDTLRIEADRLMHLVENVLAYARLERGRPSGRVRSMPVDELLAAALPRPSQRAMQAELQINVRIDPATERAHVLADPSAVEQILFNLIDNACKYAAESQQRTLEVDVLRSSGQLSIRVRDHGPGLSAALQRRLFQPFRKSADDAARSAPGVGLGLALSRRLARDIGGDLRFDSTVIDGAAFTVLLPLGNDSSESPTT
jgi:signal transduction histidine kinase